MKRKRDCEIIDLAEKFGMDLGAAHAMFSAGERWGKRLAVPGGIWASALAFAVFIKTQV